jgi:hypothetical protein
LSGNLRVAEINQVMSKSMARGCVPKDWKELVRESSEIQMREYHDMRLPKVLSKSLLIWSFYARPILLPFTTKYKSDLPGAVKRYLLGHDLVMKELRKKYGVKRFDE